MRKITIIPSDETMQVLQRERRVRKLESVLDTITAVLRDYFKMAKRPEVRVNVQGKKNVIQKTRENKYVHYLLIFVYIAIIFTVLVNIINWEIPYLNVAYSTINSPTDYKFLQTYPPSIDGIEVGNANQTIIFQVHIHADKMITENTPVNIEAGEESTYASNVSAIGIGFFGANYIESEQTLLNGYELWTGWAGERLYQSVKPETMVIFVPNGGVTLGGFNTTVFWSEAGDKAITIVLEWANSSAFISSHTYQLSTVHVYAYADIRASQIADSELIVVFGVSLFGAFEVYPSITGRKKD